MSKFLSAKEISVIHISAQKYLDTVYITTGYNEPFSFHLFQVELCLEIMWHLLGTVDRNCVQENYSTHAGYAF